MVTLGKRSEENEFLNIKEFGGQLYIVKILVYYDYPRIFVCQNENDGLYLFNETRDEDDLECWGVIKISHEDLTKFYNSELSFRDLYIIYGDNYWDVTNHYSDDTISVEKTKPTDLLEFYSETENLYYNAHKMDL